MSDSYTCPARLFFLIFPCFFRNKTFYSQVSGVSLLDNTLYRVLLVTFILLFCETVSLSTCIFICHLCRASFFHYVTVSTALGDKKGLRLQLLAAPWRMYFCILFPIDLQRKRGAEAPLIVFIGWPSASCPPAASLPGSSVRDRTTCKSVYRNRRLQEVRRRDSS